MVEKPNDMHNSEKKSNALIHETSPYLLQHAYNPVNWYPWGDEALEKAKAENKPIIISIGYSACHWCHVMEHESFEDSLVAAIMNENFINIKVDREERPDIDQVYMEAVQIMTKRGGWPLNCITTPDGRPFYGGTYFPKENWISTLEQLSKIYQDEPEKVNEYANQLTAGIRQGDELVKVENVEQFSKAAIEKGLGAWVSIFDKEDGGTNHAPKFPMPNNYEYLLEYGKINSNHELIEHVELTLEKMAFGGIYDQIGGGFARYSTDMEWKVPHFEKMLYDNAQLLGLYAQAYRLTKKELYKEVIYQTVDFMEEEWLDKSGAFYSALDADSEGEEGKYYIWTKEELQSILNQDFDLIKEYYNINSKGLWENDHYILLRNESDESFAEKHRLTIDEWQAKKKSIQQKLLAVRGKRVKPGLDDKSLTSWNALASIGLIEAYKSFGEERFLKLATKNIHFILDQQLKHDGSLFHSYKKGVSSINGFLEDYSFTIEALLALYEVSFKESYLDKAKQLMDYTIENFYSDKSGYFYFTNKNDSPLISRKFEISDNVIPSSNSSMAKASFRLGNLLYNERYLNISRQMLSNISLNMSDYLPYHSNWGILLNHHLSPFYEIAIVGDSALTKRQEMQSHFLPNCLFLGSQKSSSLELLEKKWNEGETSIYVCYNKACQLPVSLSDQALKQINWH